MVAEVLFHLVPISKPAALDPETIALAQAEYQEISASRAMSLRRTTFEALHNLSNPSVKSIMRLVSSQFVWPGMRRNINRWMRSCKPC